MGITPVQWGSVLGLYRVNRLEVGEVFLPSSFIMLMHPSISPEERLQFIGTITEGDTPKYRITCEADPKKVKRFIRRAWFTFFNTRKVELGAQ